MNRQQKEAAISEVKEMLTTANALFIVNYQGLSVKGMLALRKSLREKGGKLKVAKARLMKRAAEGIKGIDPFRDSFKEQVGIVFAFEEPSPVAKKLVDFAKDHELLKIVSGFYESGVLTREQVEAFAAIPSKEVLLGQLAGLLQSPVAGFARQLNMLLVGLLLAMKQVSEKQVSEKQVSEKKDSGELK